MGDYGTSLTDGAALLAYSKQSLDALNRDMTRQGSKMIDNHSFRANVIVDTLDGKPFQEDNWKEIRFGNDVSRHSLQNLMFCPRCNLPGIDPETGVQRADGEPTKWLKKNRM